MVLVFGVMRNLLLQKCGSLVDGSGLSLQAVELHVELSL